jgi:polyferredoxin
MKLQYFRYSTQIIYLILLFYTFIVSLRYFMLLILISTLLGGAFFCGWFCPFGSIQEIINNIKLSFIKQNYSIPKKYHKYLIYIRYIFLILSLIGLSSLFIFDARISFLDMLNGNTISTISYISLFVFIVSCFFFQRLFCNYFCIQGSIYGLICSLRIMRIKRNTKTCINCKICDNICPMNINISQNKYVNSLQCINCFKCIDECPKKNTLKYSLINFKEILINKK